jgi:hypothetical protein
MRFAHLPPDNIPPSREGKDGVVRGEQRVLAEELLALDTDSPLWDAARPLLDAALRLDQQDDTYIWHGWDKKQVEAFLKRLPQHCTLLAGVWQTMPGEHEGEEQEKLVLGVVCEVLAAEVRSVRTFAAFIADGLPPVEQLEPGYEHARALMQVVSKQVAPVAWALFTDKPTWDEWLLTPGDDGAAIDKGELLASFARDGRCVLMGTQTLHHR